MGSVVARQGGHRLRRRQRLAPGRRRARRSRSSARSARASRRAHWSDIAPRRLQRAARDRALTRSSSAARSRRIGRLAGPQAQAPRPTPFVHGANDGDDVGCGARARRRAFDRLLRAARASSRRARPSSGSGRAVAAARRRRGVDHAAGASAPIRHGCRRPGPLDSARGVVRASPAAPVRVPVVPARASRGRRGGVRRARCARRDADGRGQVALLPASRARARGADDRRLAARRR